MTWFSLDWKDLANFWKYYYDKFDLFIFQSFVSIHSYVYILSKWTFQNFYKFQIQKSYPSLPFIPITERWRVYSFCQDVSKARRKLQRFHKVYIFLITIKLWIMYKHARPRIVHLSVCIMSILNFPIAARIKLSTSYLA